MTFAVTRRWWWLGQQALREVVHLRIAWLLGAIVLVMIAGVSVLREFNFGTEEKRFLCDYAEASLALWGTVVAIVLTLALIQGETARGSLVLTSVRGVRRHEWLVARWLAVGVTLAWLTLLGYAVLGGLLRWHGHGGEERELVFAAGRMFLRLWLVSSFALAAAVVARGFLLASGLALGLTLAAQLASILDWAGRHNGAAARWYWQLVDCLVPAFQMLEPGTRMGDALLYATGYAILYAVVACTLFSRREI